MAFANVLNFTDVTVSSSAATVCTAGGVTTTLTFQNPADFRPQPLMAVFQPGTLNNIQPAVDEVRDVMRLVLGRLYILIFIYTLSFVFVNVSGSSALLQRHRRLIVFDL
jgi:hypothetical protein